MADKTLKFAQTQSDTWEATEGVFHVSLMQPQGQRGCYITFGPGGVLGAWLFTSRYHWSAYKANRAAAEAHIGEVFQAWRDWLRAELAQGDDDA